MSRPVLLHPDAVKFLDSLGEADRKKCFEALKRLADDPVTARSGCDIKKLAGGRKTAYRLRVGAHRFIYVIQDGEVCVEEAFRRSRGY